jgi:GxxExxY protein
MPGDRDFGAGNTRAPGRQMAEIVYKNEGYRILGVCFEVIKAVKELVSEHLAQVFNYLHATGYKLGLLVNFGSYPKVESERIVL